MARSLFKSFRVRRIHIKLNGEQSVPQRLCYRSYRIASVEEFSVEAENRDGNGQTSSKSNGLYLSLTHHRLLRVIYNLILSRDDIFVVLCSARYEL